MKEYRSGIIGRARANFGGAIQIRIHGGDGKAAVSLSEVKQPLNVGDRIPDDAELYPPQVWLAFDNLTSIDMMRDALDCLEVYLKTGDFPKPSKYPREQVTKEKRE